MKLRKITTFKSFGILFKRVETSLLILGIAFKLFKGLRTLRFLNAFIFSLVLPLGKKVVTSSITLKMF
jgi:hypothetical protein